MAKIIARNGDEITLQVTLKLSGSLLEMENIILDGCNELGCAATVEALKRFDTDGSAIKVGETKLTARSKDNQTYQSPYGSVKLERYVYQSSKGGKIFCPLEQNARIIRSATPKFAQQISHKYATMNAPSVCLDLKENHHRTIAHSYLQDVGDWVGSIAQAKEEIWEYDTPPLDEAITTVTISLDGAYILMREDGYREAMVGSISLYNVKGERQHTVYIGEAPEYGKGNFFNRLEREIDRIKKQYPQAQYLGIADGSSSNWTFLERHTSSQLLDFFHVTEYLAKVAYAAYPGKTDKAKRTLWLEEKCKQLKHEPNTAKALMSEMEVLARKTSLTKTIKENLQATQTYFNNHHHMMNYAEHTKKDLPIGSGVTEAACKTLVKQRLCGSGMRWKNQGAKVILSLRALIQSKGRWAQFWGKIDQYGATSCK
jgi:hypothetical protein